MVASAHLKLAFKWIALLNTLDYAGMASVMSANFTNRERPTSMGFPPVGKQEYIDRLKASPIGYFNVSRTDLEETAHHLPCFTDLPAHAREYSRRCEDGPILCE
jgi:hypothetical protein